MTDLLETACSNCRFYLREGAHGICRRYPPNVVPVMTQGRVLLAGQSQGPQLGLQAAFPPMAAEGWCGEHVLKTEGSA